MQLPRHRADGTRTRQPTRSRLLGRGWRRAALLTGAALAVVAAPTALAFGGHGSWGHSATLKDNTPIKGAIHNPAGGSYFRTTGIFATFGGWATRIQNLGSGGAGTFACKAGSSGSACLASENGKGGLAFAFASNGASAGKIMLTNPNGTPFTTNAHGEVKELNANMLQGKEASAFLPAAGTAADSSKLGGQPASAYATNGRLMFADVNAEGGLVNKSGATASAKSGESFVVTFGSADVSKCSYTASPAGAASTGQIGVEPTAKDASAVTVNMPKGFTGGFDLQVIC